MADIFSGYQLEYTVGERYIMREDRYGIAYGYEIDSFGEDRFNIYIYTGEERGRQLSYSPEWKKRIDANDAERLAVMAAALCDIYGEIENKEQIVSDFVSFATKNRDKFESEEWNAKYGQLYFYAYLVENKEGTGLLFHDFSIRDAQRKKFDDDAEKREAQAYIESNPYKYTDKKLKHPQPMSAKEVKKIFDNSTLDYQITSTEDFYGYDIHGSKTVGYAFKAGDRTEDCGLIATNYNLSGRRVILELTYLYDAAIDVILQDDYIIEAAKIVCQVYGDVKDEKGLLEKVRQKVEQENADYKKYNSSTWYVENKGMYLVAEHGKFKTKDSRTACIRLWLFTKDSLQAELYPYRKNDDWQGQLYREIIGNS